MNGIKKGEETLNINLCAYVCKPVYLHTPHIQLFTYIHHAYSCLLTYTTHTVVYLHTPHIQLRETPDVGLIPIHVYSFLQIHTNNYIYNAQNTFLFNYFITWLKTNFMALCTDMKGRTSIEQGFLLVLFYFL